MEDCTWNKFLETVETLFFWIKIIQNLPIFAYLPCSTKSRTDCKKPIVGQGKIPGPFLNIICAVLWI